MKEIPILFSGEMVRAILAGTKTQTRRIVKPQPSDQTNLVEWNTANEAFVPWRWGFGLGGGGKRTGQPFSCPYGVLGDRLWVRETCILPTFDDDPTEVIYRADHADPAAMLAEVQEGADGDVRWRPSIHMPRWASRIDLEVTAVRCERLQGITEEDAIAEGIARVPFVPDDGFPVCDGYMMDPDDGKSTLQTSARSAFEQVWNAINSNRKGGASWASNPFVWVVSFKAVKR